MDIRDVTTNQMTEFFINDPALCYLGLPDHTLHILYHKKRYEPNANSLYKAIYKGDTMIALVCYEQFSSLSINIHFYVASELQRNGLALKIQNFLYKYIINKYPNLQKSITTIPSCCDHVIRSAERFGLKLEGRLTNCVVWRDKVVDLLFYACDLKQGEEEEKYETK